MGVGKLIPIIASWSTISTAAIYIYIYLFIFHPRYLHSDIFRYMTLEITHSRYFTSVISTILLYCYTAHYPCSYSNWPNFSIFSGFTATFLRCTLLFLLNRVRAAAKISAGGVGSPYNQLYAVSYPSSSTYYSSEGI